MFWVRRKRTRGNFWTGVLLAPVLVVAIMYRPLVPAQAIGLLDDDIYSSVDPLIEPIKVSEAVTMTEPQAQLEEAPVPKPELPKSVEPVSATDCSVQACLALTFDDGPDPVVTPIVLDVLAKEQVKATFFVLGNHAQKYPVLIKQVHQAGHEIGNHSWAHANFTKLTPAQMADDIKRTQVAVVAAGVPAPRFFRPPYGARNAQVNQAVGMPLAIWNIDPKDWRRTNPNELVAEVVATAKPGGIIVMHDTEANTAQSLQNMIMELKKRFHLVTVSELLQLPLGTTGEFSGRK